MTTFIFGDSHGRFNFTNLLAEHVNLSQNSVTMHRVGRDCQFPNFKSHFLSPNNVFVFCYGEVDCRCHVGRQLLLNERSLEDIVRELAVKYINAILATVLQSKKIIVCSITPPLRRLEYENVHGPITHEFPFVGSDEERSKYTRMLNSCIENLCNENGLTFLNVYQEYAREDGTLQFEKSDGICHIKENEYILNKFIQVLNS